MGLNIVLLGVNFFGINLSTLNVQQMAAFVTNQENTLVHEAIHAIDGVTDDQFFTNPVLLNAGLDPSAYKASGGRDTDVFTAWLDRGCTKQRNPGQTELYNISPRSYRGAENRGRTRRKQGTDETFPVFRESSDPHLALSFCNAREETGGNRGRTRRCRFFVKPDVGRRGRGRDGLATAPRTDPYERLSRIRLLPWMGGVKANIRIWMHDADAGNPPANQAVHALPVDAACLASTA